LNLAHSLADTFRDHCGYAFLSFPGGAPRMSMWLKHWHKALEDQTFGRLKPELRIPYAVDRQFGPGLWAPSDVDDSTAAGKSLRGRLRNLGSAVGPTAGG
jgi:hypothetical protein